MSEYVIRGRASVITSDIEVSVLMKEQLTEIIKWLIEYDFSFEYDVEMGDSITPTKYSIRVPDMPWASNLKEFAKVLELSDYAMGIRDDEQK